MAIVGRAPEGVCPQCGEHGATAENDDRVRCWNCEHVWTPQLVTDGGTDVDPVICDRLRRIYRRGPAIEEIASLFDFDTDDVCNHLAGDCECRNSELAVSTLEGRQ